jgi:hypothetical protein
MMALPFTASCQRGHDLIEFTEREPFERHMTEVHKARKPNVGGASPATCDRKAPGITDGKIDKPYPWKAPNRTPGGIERVAQRIAAGEYEWPGRPIWFPVGIRYGKGEPAGEVA